jgi:N-acetylglucosamine-6-sulfatase
MRLLSARRVVFVAVAVTLVVLAAAGSTVVVSTKQSAAAGGGGDSRPNIVLILVDDMAERDLQYMPTVQALLADEGTTFENSFTPFSLCCPDRTSILTGQYAHNHGVLGNGTHRWPLGGFKGFDTDNNTLATWLDGAGYQTAFVGKYLNRYGTADAPARVPPGWDDWHATKGVNYQVARMYENGVNKVYRNVYMTDFVTDLSDNIIERRMPRPGPLFLWTSYIAPHDGRPHDPDDCTRFTGRGLATPSPAAEFRDAFAGLPLGTDPSINERHVTDKPIAIRSLPRIRPKMMTCLTELNQQRLESLQSVDRGVAEIVNAVTAAGEIDNTVFVFTSDNGYMVGQHRVLQGKVLPYEPSIRVPLVVRGPGFPAGVTRSQLTATIDLAPTFADLADAAPKRTIDGVSLLPIASDPTASADRDIVLEAGPSTPDGPMTFTGLRTERYKYVEYATGERELYDLHNDPFELVNLAGDPSVAQVEQTLADELAEIRNCSGRACDAETPGF